jgi:hypothetical protein
MKPHCTARRLLIASCFLLAASCGGGKDSTKPQDSGPFERFDAGFFSINKPRGWTVTIAGSCSQLAFLLRDPQNPLRQIFYFGTVGPVYTSQAQKDLDRWYVDHGGYDIITWLDAPVVDPLTPQNYLSHWPEIAAMDAAGRFMADFPHLQGLTLIANSPRAALIPGGETSDARGLFSLNGQVGEGMFLATVKEFMPYTGNPGGGTAYGNFVCGVTAPKAEFPGVMTEYIQSLESFSITQAYVDDCMRQQQAEWGALAAAGQTLSEASDIIFEGWQDRTHVEDISAEKWTDAFRDVERVYDPATGDVYEFPAGWYEQYDPNRNQYQMSDLQPLPADDWDLWMRGTLDGPSRIH